jgi:hypothetical protein
MEALLAALKRHSGVQPRRCVVVATVGTGGHPWTCPTT